MTRGGPPESLSRGRVARILDALFVTEQEGQLGEGHCTRIPGERDVEPHDRGYRRGPADRLVEVLSEEGRESGRDPGASGKDHCGATPWTCSITFIGAEDSGGVEGGEDASFAKTGSRCCHHPINRLAYCRR